MLFDTGLVCWRFLRNLKKFDISPESIDRIAISHGHMDHVRGIKALAKTRTINTKLKIFAHPNIMEKKRAFLYGIKLWNAGFPKMTTEQMDKLEFDYSKELREIEPNIFLSGEIPFEKRKGEQNLSQFFWHNVEGNWEHDPIIDEQFMIIKTVNGLVIMSGDCHPGLKNTLFRIRELFDEEIYAFIGGLHLTKTTNKKIVKISEDIKQNFSNIKFYLNHSSIVRAISHFKKKLGEDIINNFYHGSEMIFEY
jgi:7,8-dihydropterin-6-yl-methyl-4-(beta-D-ribofuranosyl)aminobenzene 5'-phosphate synthase